MFNFEQYKLKIVTATDGTITRHIIDTVNTENTLALKKERRKLYIVHLATTILYVGEAYCALQTRLQRGTVPFNRLPCTQNPPKATKEEWNIILESKK